MKLSPKQRAFVTEYLKDFNGTQAAIRAGYSPRAAAPQSTRLLTKANIQKAIQDAQEKAKSSAIMTLSECMEVLTGIARADLTDYVDPKTGRVNLKRGDPRALLEITQTIGEGGAVISKYKLQPKLQAMKQLAEICGWEASKQMRLEVEGTILLPPADPLHGGKGLKKVHAGTD